MNCNLHILRLIRQKIHWEERKAIMLNIITRIHQRPTLIMVAIMRWQLEEWLNGWEIQRKQMYRIKMLQAL